MTLKKTLPRVIRCQTVELALAVGQLLREGGFDDGHQLAPDVAQAHAAQTKGMSLSRDKLGKFITGQTEVYVDTLAAAIALLIEPPFLINGYVVTAKPDGVQVGCQFVTWADVDKVAALNPGPAQLAFPPLPVGDTWANHLNLTPEQFEVYDGWRPLLKSEVEAGFSYVGSQYWDDYKKTWSKTGDYTSYERQTGLLRVMTNMPQGHVKHTPHNPLCLSDEIVCVREGWRLLDEDEITTAFNVVRDAIQCWEQGVWSRGSGCFAGNDKGRTYRTKLTRLELLARRKDATK